MKILSRRSILFFALALAPSFATAQGRFTWNSNVGAITNGVAGRPLTTNDGDYLFELVRVDTNQNIRVGLKTTTLQVGPTASPGTLALAAFSVNGIPPGTPVNLQVRGWDTRLGNTWAEVVVRAFGGIDPLDFPRIGLANHIDPDVLLGISKVFSYTPGSISGPAMGNLYGLTMLCPLPEPNALVLAMPAVLLFLRRRRETNGTQRRSFLLLATALLGATPSLCPAQGRFTFNSNVRAITNVFTGQPLTTNDGSYLFQLVAVAANGDRIPLATTTLQMGSNASPGTLQLVPFSANGYPAGTPVNLQVRGWDTREGNDTWEKFVNFWLGGFEPKGQTTLGDGVCSIYGISKIFAYTPGSISGPAMGNLWTIILFPTCPEPQVLTLALPAVLLFARRRRAGGGPRRRLLLFLASAGLAIQPDSCPAQGRFTFNSNVRAITNCLSGEPLTTNDGSYLFQLVVVAANGDRVALATTTLQMGSNASPGTLQLVPFSTNGYPAGTPVNLQVRAWDTRGGYDTWEKYVRRHLSGFEPTNLTTLGETTLRLEGFSKVFSYTPGSISGPAMGNLWNLIMMPIVPEPRVLALALPAALLFLRRRRAGGGPRRRLLLFLACAGLAVWPDVCPAQGRFTFNSNTRAITKYFTGQPLTTNDGSYLFQLVAVQPNGDRAPLATTTLQIGSNATPGTLWLKPFTALGHPAGTPVNLQVRAWDTRGGNDTWEKFIHMWSFWGFDPSYPTALGETVLPLYGLSKVFTYTPGAISGPAMGNLWTLCMCPVPEPRILALTLPAALLFAQRRRAE